MAQRRMISLKVTDTDNFLEMPSTSQNLYFHLLNRADDDGFLGNSKKIMRMVRASEDDMNVLISKDFVIPFRNGVCVIKHWRIHNLIRADRYTETIYKKEKRTLMEGENKEYLPWQPDVIPIDNPDGNRLEPQVRLGKSSSPKGEEEDNTVIKEKSSLPGAEDFITDEDVKNMESLWN